MRYCSNNSRLTPNWKTCSNDWTFFTNKVRLKSINMNYELLFSILFSRLFFPINYLDKVGLEFILVAGQSGIMATWTIERLLINRFFIIFSGRIKYKLSNRFDVNANFTYVKISGADSLAKQKFNLKRMLNFYLNVYKWSILFKFRIWYMRIFNRYIFADVGCMKFNSIVDYNNEVI